MSEEPFFLLSVVLRVSSRTAKDISILLKSYINMHCAICLHACCVELWWNFHTYRTVNVGVAIDYLCLLLTF